MYIYKQIAILTSGSVAPSEVSPLQHEVRDDSVEGGALEPQVLGGSAALAGAEGAEIL